MDVDTTNLPGRPEVQVSIDRDRAADLGVTVQHVAQTLQMLVAGVKASTFPEQGEEYEVRIRAEERFRSDAESLALMSVPSTKYGSVPLSSVVSWDRGMGPSRINRYGRQRQITLLANAAPGAGDNDVSAIIDAGVQGCSSAIRLQHSADGSVQVSGRSRCGLPLGAQHGVRLHVPDSGCAVRVVALSGNHLELVAAHGAVRVLEPFDLQQKPQHVLDVGPLGALWRREEERHLAGGSHESPAEIAGEDRFDSLMEANRDRLRPILMTTVAFVAGMLPLLFSSGIGAGFNKATASIVVGGQTLRFCSRSSP